MFFTFRFLIIIPVENKICQDMVLMNPMPLMCMRYQHKVKFFYLSRMPLGKFVTSIGSTCWNLWHTVLPCKCGTLGLKVSSAIPTYLCMTGKLLRMLLSTACRIRFTGCPVMCLNFLPQISPLYITGGLLLLLFLHLCNGRFWIFHCDLYIVIVIEKVPHLIIQKTILGNFECRLLWSVDGKFIPILTVICHQVMLLYQYNW